MRLRSFTYESSGMRELARLLRYSRPYTPHLIFSVLLMACVGAAQALTALLIGPVFDRVRVRAAAAHEPEERDVVDARVVIAGREFPVAALGREDPSRSLR